MAKKMLRHLAESCESAFQRQNDESHISAILVRNKVAIGVILNPKRRFALKQWPFEKTR